jgi:hypothetical protein
VPGQSEVKELFFRTIDTLAIAAHHENQIQTKNGEFRDIVWNNTMLRDRDGRVIGTASLG